jgi:DNA-binding transcriptional LysR family regulator
MVTRLNLVRVASFVVLAEELHFGRAAARLHISQPGLSQQIRLLEEYLGFDLFSRRSSGVVLTDAGAHCLEDMRRLITEAELTLNNAQAYARRTAGGEVRLGYSEYAAVEYVPAIASWLRRTAPDLGVKLLSYARGPDCIEALERGECDVVLLAHALIPETGFSRCVLRDEPLVAVLPAAHPLAARDEVPLALLAEEPFGLFPRESNPAIWDAIMTAFDSAGRRPVVVHDTGRIADMLVWAATFDGVLLLPGISATRIEQAGMVHRPVTPPVSTGMQAAAWLSSNRNPAVALVAHAVRAVDHGEEDVAPRPD